MDLCVAFQFLLKSSLDLRTKFERYFDESSFNIFFFAVSYIDSYRDFVKIHQIERNTLRKKV